jgi:hypothetical protein
LLFSAAAAGERLSQEACRTLANLMIEANRFETIMAPAPAGTPPNVAHSSDISPTGRDGVDERCVEAGGGVVVCQKVPEPAPKRR